MITLPVIKGLIPEIDAYIKEGHKVVMEISEDGKVQLDVEKLFDKKRKCPYYIVQLPMVDSKDNESYFISAKIFCVKRDCGNLATADGDFLETIVCYEIEHDDKVRSVQTVIQTIDDNKCLVERTIQKTQASQKIETANISERLIFEERDGDSVLIERIMYAGDILVPYVSLVGSRKWNEYKNNPGNLTKVRNFKYIKTRGSESGAWE